MLATMLAIVLGAPQATTLELFRGADLGGPTRYWAVEDTTLDNQEADQNLGGLPTLGSGPGKTLLIKFADLNRAVGSRVRVKSAQLVLSVVSGRPSSMRGVYALRAPFGEGPAKTLTLFDPQGGPRAAAARGSSTWKQRRAGPGGANWQQPGASGLGDATPIEGAFAESGEGDKLVVKGLGPTVQRMLDRWYDNHGLSLTFDGVALFGSSQSASDRPRLELTLEPAPAATGADLSATSIEVTPEYPRYGAGVGVSTGTQDGRPISVPIQQGTAETKRWPASGESVTYVGHIKNVGDAPSGGYGVRWVVNEQQGSLVETSEALAPGAQTTVRLTLPYKGDHKDHRANTVRLVLEPRGPDAVAANNAVEIHEGALSLAFYVERGFAAQFIRDPNETGTSSVEDWLQGQVRTWNDVVMPQSRFSFAPEGSLERVRIQRIVLVDDGALSGVPALPGGQPNRMLDAEWGFRAADAARAEKRWLDRGMVRELGAQLGLPQFDTMAARPEAVALLLDGSRVDRGSTDRFPGLMGGGDTRNDALIPGDFSMPYEPIFDPLTGLTPMEATDLYSATDVAALNANLGKRRGVAGAVLYDVPSMVLLRVADGSGSPLANATLEFHQTVGGVVPNGPPTFSVTTSPSGTVLLPSRPMGDAAPLKTPDGHTLSNNPFGRIDATGGNGLLLVRVFARGVHEWAWIKLWQLVDARNRAGKDVVFFDLRFHVPSAPFDAAVNLAQNRIVADSSESLPGKLAALVDENPATDVQLGTKPGDWIEIDLGRDRPAGEIRLLSKGPMWKQFDIAVFETGQRPTEAQLWARELDFDWSVANRGGVEGVPYRGRLARFRFVRIINRSGGPGSLAEIRVAPVKLEGS